MTEPEEGANKGLSPAEKRLIIRAVLVGVVAPVATLWAGGGPAAFGFSMALACLGGLLVATAIAVMGGSFIEDLVKLLLFGAFWLLWHLLDKYAALEMVMLGLAVGSLVGFLGNRLYGASNTRV